MNEFLFDTMLDLETYSTRSDARIIQIGAVNFHRFSGTVEKPVVIKKFKVNVDTSIGRVSDDTILWWDQQKANAPELEVSLNNPEPISLEEALIKYKKFVKGSSCVWSNGSNFDTVILDNAFIECNISNPFRFWQARDMRTMVELFDPIGMFKEASMISVIGYAHDAVVDCMRQTYIMQRCFNEYRKMQDLKRAKA